MIRRIRVYELLSTLNSDLANDFGLQKGSCLLLTL
jgi:hypothetical protein